MYENVDPSWIDNLKTIEAISKKRLTEHDRVKSRVLAVQNYLKSWCVPDGEYYEFSESSWDFLLSLENSQICLTYAVTSELDVQDAGEEPVPLLQCDLATRELFMETKWEQHINKFLAGIIDMMADEGWEA